MAPLLPGFPEVIEALKTGTYTVTRRATGEVVRGRIQPGTPTTFTIDASVQPLGTRELLRLPEGMRARERRLVFSPVQLFSGPSPDTLVIEGWEWEVEGAEDWHVVASFWRCIVVRVED